MRNSRNGSPLVSVVIPTYNRKDFLLEAIDSVLKQTYEDYEVLVVDDGSTDGTYDIILNSYSQLLGKKIFYIYQDNRGVSSARNVGIEEAKGRYIAFLDSDDLWDKKKLEIQMKYLTNSEYKICYTNEIWIKNGKKINQKKKHQKYSGRIFKYCLPLCIISPSSVVIDKEVIDKVGKFDEELKVCEDYDLWLRICSRYEVLFIDEKLITKRAGHSNQLSFTYKAMDRFRIKAMEKVYLDNLSNKFLSEEENILLVKEIIGKSKILYKGYLKRENIEMANYYNELINKYSFLIS